jgi:hypothetical protein
VGKVAAHEPLEDGFSLGRAEAQGRRIFDHLVVVLTDQIPVHGTREDRLQMGVRVGVTSDGAIQLLRGDRFETWHQFEAQQGTQSKADMALPGRVGLWALNGHLGTVAQHALDHRGHL